MTSAVGRELSAASILPVGAKGNAKGKGEGIVFADSMQNASAQQTGFSEETTSVLRADTAQNAFEKLGKTNVSCKEGRSQKVTEEDASMKDSDVEQNIEEAKEKITRSIAEKTGMSEEEVEAMMEQLGFGIVDLMQNGNMAMLVSALMGTEPVSALTKEDVFLTITDLTNMVQTELGALSIDAEELFEQGMVLDETIACADEQSPSFTDVISAGSEEVAEMAEMEETVSTSYEIETEGLDRERTSKTANTQQTNATVQSEEKISLLQKPEKKEAGDGFEPKENQFGAPQQPQVNSPVSVEAQEGFSSGLERSVNAQELLEQIAQSVKVQYSEQVTEMEISLNPASLGNVHLQIASKDGIVSAQLITQNEAVKAALESQIMQLKENLDAQGIKVTEVEVTVGAHQFEENLDRQGKQDEKNAMEQSKKNTRRILDLDQIDEDGTDADGEALSQAERLQVEMMRMGGNKLSFRV